MQLNDKPTIVIVAISACLGSLVGCTVQGFAVRFAGISIGALVGAYGGVFAAVGFGFWDTLEARTQAKNDALEEKLKTTQRKAKAQRAKAKLLAATKETTIPGAQASDHDGSAGLSRPASPDCVDLASRPVSPRIHDGETSGTVTTQMGKSRPVSPERGHKNVASGGRQQDLCN